VTSTATHQLVGTGTITLTLPSGVTLETIHVRTPPGTPGSASPYTEQITWSQCLTRPRRRYGKRVWVVTVSWDVTVPHVLEYAAS
jgi:hypothetical protein